jgi:DNA-binding response OmpR family regulator
MRVLVVEDHKRLAKAVADGLRREGIAVDLAFDGREALTHVAINRYDVVVLDRDLPGVHGDDVCRALVAEGSGTRVLMLTASSTIKDRVDGLGLGADDYLPKPFHFPELVLRIRALARRQPMARSRTLRAAGVELDPLARTVTRDGRALDLSVKEFAVLEALLKASPGTLSAENLLAQAWDENIDPFTNTVKVTIGRLRRKLGEPQIIYTTPAIGYRIKTEVSTSETAEEAEPQTRIARKAGSRQ